MIDSAAPIFLSVAMPAYNEEASIDSVIRDHVKVLESIGGAISQWEIVCVDDGSIDRTPAILKNLQLSVPQLRIVRQENQGITGALSRALRETRGTHVYCTGSDGQWPASNLTPMLSAIQTGSDLVVGVRINRHEVYTVFRRCISRVFNYVPRLLFGVDVGDAGSIKLGIRDVFVFDLLSSSPFLEAERIIKAKRCGFQVTFVPIQFRARTGGEASGVSWKNIRSSISDLFRCLEVYSPV